MPATKALGLAALGALLCGGCTVGPHYARPAVPTGQTYAAGKAALGPSAPQAAQARLPAPGPAEGPEPAPGGEPVDAWWTVFHDPELEALIHRALAQNRDIQVAIERVREARAERVVVAGGLLPNVDATGGYNRARGSKNVVLPLGQLAGGSGGSGGSASGGSSGKSSGASSSGIHSDQVSGSSGSGGSPASGASLPLGGSSPSTSAGEPPGGPNNPFGEGGLPGVTTNLYQAGFDALYEFDLFGGTRRAIEAADAQAAAAVEGERGVEISLLAEVAGSYLQLREAQARERIARSNLSAERATWKIADDTFRAGLGNEALVAQDAAQMHLTEATLPQILSQEQAARQSLAFLLAEDPDALDAELAAPAPLPALPPELPLGLPSDLIRRRPDIRQAERQLAAASAEIGVATAQLFPRFSITGQFGFDSSTLKALPRWGSHYYSIAPGVSWPILDWAQLHAAIHVENSLQAQALLAYQTAVAQAFKDVQDALVQYESERERHAALVLAERDARRALQIARQTFSQGLADQLTALDAERSLLQVQDALAQSDANLRLDLVALYKALGGGWRNDVN